ncbi:MAG: S9 family peptidase [Myxococcota bacterium]
MQAIVRSLVAFVAWSLVACGSSGLLPTPPEPTGSPTPTGPTPPAPVPPVAKKIPVTRTLHGDVFVDDYAWLREKGTPAVEDYLDAEAAYADQVMAPLGPLRETLYQEILGHIDEDDQTVPAADGAWSYWKRTAKGKSYPTYYRRGAAAGAADETLLDVEALAVGKPFMDVGIIDASDGGRYLLYATDELGFREYTLHVKDLQTGETLPDAIPHVVTADWTTAPGQIVDVVEDEAKRPFRALRHVLGQDPAKDVVVYDEKDARYELYGWRSINRDYIVLHAESKLSTEVRLVDARHPERAPILVAARDPAVMYYVEPHGRELVIRANDKGRNFRIVTAPITRPGRKAWKELVAHDDKTMLEEHSVNGDELVVEVRSGGMPELDVIDLRTKARSRIPTAAPAHEIGVEPNGNLEPAPKELRYTYESLATPKQVMAYDFATKATRVLRDTPVPGFDASAYVTERLLAKAGDGTAVPISIVRRKDVALDGKAPLHLYGYGSYGISSPLRFSPARLALLDRGVIFAIAHIRGGGELGKAWHEGGRLATKMNTFTDFIACAETLVAQHYTAVGHISIEGRSAGGLLMGAVLNLRPDLFRAAIVAVPFVDVVNTMNDPTLPLTITEYEEWGNPQKADEYAWIRPYSPYDNIAAKAYPAMLVETSYNDSQVMYWEPAKYVARMRALRTDDHPLLFRINMEGGGHGGKSGRYDHLREVAVDQAFILWQQGLAP